MKPDHWQQLDKLFHSALERKRGERAAYLDEACAGDQAIREQVELLLTAHEEAGSFIESPAIEIEARGVVVDSGSIEPELANGEIVAHYRIISPIGAGGMGQVFLAHDMKLGRKVALKLLPTEFTRNTDRVRRFQQEARAASSLNHPNIITIHEVGQAGGRHFIDTEYIEGETLRQRIISSQPLRISEVLSVGMQVASALSAAHAKGIIHRDIKPENIILVKDDHLMQKECFVKVLDFGIAKLTEQTAGEAEATTRVLLNTHEGSVIGTASYMSPEQARGEKVDARTDIWSLGIVLYEMITKTLPFGGDTAQDVIASILKGEQPPLPVRVTDRLRWIVEKALRKERDERYQTITEIFSDLREVQSQRRKITRVAQLAKTVKLHPRTVVAALAAFLIAVAGTVYVLYKSVNQNQIQSIGKNQAKPPPPFQTMKMERLTSTGRVTDAAISPDGKYVVHVKEEGSQQSLWLRQVSAPNDVQIIPPADVSYLGLTFSPNGDYLYYNAWDKKNPSTLYQMSVLGGTSRKLIVDIDSIVSFSPDGKQFAFLRGYPPEGELALLVANADGSAERKLGRNRLPARTSMGVPAWSPDGKIIAYPGDSTDASGSFMALVEVQVANGTEKRIGSQRWWQIDRLAWIRDGSGLVFTAREGVAGPSQLWYVTYPGGEARRITNDLNDYLSVGLTSDSAVLVTVESEQISNIWIAPYGNARSASQITNSNSDGVEGISWTPDDKIIYAKHTSNHLDLWMVDANGSRQKQLTSDTGNNRRPSVSTDGRYVVFVSDRTGTDHIWRIDIDGNNAKQLTNGDGEWDPHFSPNGEWVLYQLRTGKQDVWKVPIDGGEPMQIVNKATGALAISPDGRWIATAYFESSIWKTAIYSINGGAPSRMLDISSFWIGWTSDGRALIYLDQTRIPNLSTQPIDGGPPNRLTDFTSDRVFSFALSRDGKRLAMARGTLTHDVVLIRNFKDLQ